MHLSSALNAGYSAPGNWHDCFCPWEMLLDDPFVCSFQLRGINPVIGSIHGIVGDLWKVEMPRFVLVASIDSISFPKGRLQHIHLIRCMLHVLQSVAVMGASYIMTASVSRSQLLLMHWHIIIASALYDPFERGLTTAINCYAAAFCSTPVHCLTLLKFVNVFNP